MRWYPSIKISVGEEVFAYRLLQNNTSGASRIFQRLLFAEPLDNKQAPMEALVA